MPHHARPQMCLSTKEHNNRVLDVSKHYFGCLRESDRRRFYNELPEKEQIRIRRQARRIEQLRTKLECQPESKAGALLKIFKEAISDWRGVHGWSTVENENTSRLPNDLDNSADSEIRASIIFFKNSRPYDIPGIENTFPNQKITIKDLLADDPDANPLMKPCDENMIRYFHLPANNMIWVEVSSSEIVRNSRYLAREMYRKLLLAITMKSGLMQMIYSSIPNLAEKGQRQRCFSRQSFGRASSTLTITQKFTPDT